MNRLFKIAITVAIIALILNDGGRWGRAFVDLHNSGDQVLYQASQSARNSTQAQLAAQLSQQAAIQQIRVTQFATTPTGVHIWAEEDVRGTWLIGPFMALTHGVPLAKAWSTPFTIHYDAEESMR